MNLLRRHWPWLLAFVVLLAIPFLFFDWSKGRHSGFVLTLMSEIGLMAIFALSYNMLMGQAGLLSFGHAVLLGMGAYCAAHVVLCWSRPDRFGCRPNWCRWPVVSAESVLRLRLRLAW